MNSVRLWIVFMETLMSEPADMIVLCMVECVVQALIIFSIQINVSICVVTVLIFSLYHMILRLIRLDFKLDHLIGIIAIRRIWEYENCYIRAA